MASRRDFLKLTGLGAAATLLNACSVRIAATPATPAPPMPARPKEQDMTRHFFATTGSNTQFPDGSYAVYDFPQFESCIVPLMGQDDTDLIDASRIKSASGIETPYHTWQSQMPRIGEHER